MAPGALSMSAAGRVNQSVRHTALLVLQIAMAGVLFGLLLVLADNHNRRFDLTPTKSFVLSDEAQRVAQGLQVPIRVTAFYNAQESQQRRQMEDVLQLFADASRRITYRLLDLDRSPALAKKYNVGSFNTGVIETDNELRELRTIDEEEITNGLLRLTRREKRTLCFITGHGEHSPKDAGDRSGYSEVGKALEKDHFEIRTVETLPAEGVPTDCTTVIVAGPSRDFLPGEADHLAGYLDGGGRVLLLVDPKAPESVVQLLARYNVRAGDDIVVDERNRFFGADSFMPRVPIFDEGTFRKNLDTAAVFSLARTLSPLDTENGSARVLLLALTSAESWAHVNGSVIPEGKVQFRRAVDKPGPLPVAVMVTAQPRAPAADAQAGPADSGGRMIVFGDSDFASNLYLNLLGNKDLFMSSVGVLAEDEELIAVRRKGLPRSSLSPVSLTERQGRMIFWSAVVVQPVGVALLGLLITWHRRMQSVRRGWQLEIVLAIGWRGTAVLALLIAIAGGFVWSGEIPPEQSGRPTENLLGEPITVDPHQPVRRLLEFQPADVVGIRLERAGAARETERSGDTWTVASQSGAINDFLHNLSELAVLMDIPAGPAELRDYGLEPPQSILQLRVRGQPAAPLVLQIGDRNPSVTGVYVRIGKEGPVVLAGALVAWEFDKAFRALGGPEGG